MKRSFKILSGILAATTALCGSIAAGAAEGGLTVRADEKTTEIAINEKNFPDEIFRDYVRQYDSDSNDSLSLEEINKVEILNCQNYGIKNLKGIEFFTELVILDCSANKLSAIDISNNVKLGELRCSSNNLTELDVSKNVKLTAISFDDNKLTTIDLSNLPDLMIVRGQYNELASINLEGDDCISVLQLPVNKLTELNLSDCTNLKILECWNNNLESLDLSTTTQVAYLDCHNNKIASIEYGTCTPDIVVCYKNQMSEIDVSKFGGLSKDLEFKIEGGYLIGTNKDEDGNVYNTLFVEELGEVKYAFNAFVVDAQSKITGTDLTLPTPAPTAKPTPTATAAPTATPTATPEPTTVTPTTEPNSVEGFAERLYTTCLGRDAEPEGRAYWAGELKAGMTGAEVAEGFFFSPEFTNLKLDDEEFITRLYKTFMNREPDKDGIDYWSKEMKNGKTTKDVFDGFVFSPEWADICYNYGIRSGGLIAPSYEIEASSKVVAFAERLYTTCLGRDAEEEGLDFWSQELANKRYTGTEAARGFFFSDEFVGLKLDDIQFIDRLYRTFMGREAEAEGFDYWFREILSGKSREEIFNGFSVAPEFAKLCAEAKINP